MRTNHINPIATAMISTVVAALLTACGGGGGDSSASTSTNTTTAESSTIVTTVPAATYATGTGQRVAFDLLNSERSTCGFGLLAQNAQLDTAAQAHADWVVTNGTLSHTETAGTTGFTGVNPSDRAAVTGYSGSTSVGEAIAGAIPTTAVAIGADKVRGLLSAPYHLMGLMNRYRDVGIGLTIGSTAAALNFDLGFTSTSPAQLLGSTDVMTYPCAGTTGTKYQLQTETPSPVPSRDLATNPVGQPVLVMVRTGNTLAITSASMTNLTTGTAVILRAPSTLANDPNPEYLEANKAYILPDAPLSPATSYQVTIAGTNNGVAFSRTFTFTTGTSA